MITEASRMGKPPFKPLASLGLAASILGPVVFIAGFVVAYLAFTAEMARLQTTQAALIARIADNGESIKSQEATIRALSQNIAELKLRAATNR